MRYLFPLAVFAATAVLGACSDRAEGPVKAAVKADGTEAPLQAEGGPDNAASEASERTVDAASAASTRGIEVGALRAHLWYEETGRLSENIAPPVAFSAFNTIIGEGQAAEIANDLFLTAEVLSNGRGQNVDVPLVLEVRDSAGRILATRTVDSVLTSPQGKSVKGLWAYDIGCSGEITFSARLGGLSRSVDLDFVCGE